MSESEIVALNSDIPLEFSSFAGTDQALLNDSEVKDACHSTLNSSQLHSPENTGELISTNNHMSPDDGDKDCEVTVPNFDGELLTAELVVCHRGNKIDRCEDEFVAQKREDSSPVECQRGNDPCRLEDEIIGQGTPVEKQEVPVVELPDADRKKKLPPSGEVKKSTEITTNGTSKTKPKTVAGVVIQNVEKPLPVQPVPTKVNIPSTRGHVEELRNKLNSPATGAAISITPSSSTPLKKKLIDVTPKGHLKDMKEKIERTISNASGKRVTTSSQQKTDIAHSVQPTPPPEEKRRQKAQEWMKKVQLSGDGGDHPPGSPGGSGRTNRITTTVGISSSAGVRRSTSWKVREDQLKNEMEERKAAQKQLDEKRQKLAEERQAIRERKQKEDTIDGIAKGLEHQVKMRTTSTEPKNLISKAERTASSPTTSTSTTFSARVQSPKEATATIQVDNTAAKKNFIKSHLPLLNIDQLDQDGLEKKARELYEDLWQLHGEYYELKIQLERRDVELDELRRKCGDSKGKFMKPVLKKVSTSSARSTSQNEYNDEPTFASPLENFHSTISNGLEKQNIPDLQQTAEPNEEVERDYAIADGTSSKSRAEQESEDLMAGKAEKVEDSIHERKETDATEETGQEMFTNNEHDSTTELID